MKKNLLMVLTGSGKGKTTSALGQAFRAVGQGLPVCFIQFVKGSWKTGEMKAAESFSGLLEFHVMGRGFVNPDDIREEERTAARDTWEFAEKKIESGAFRLVVLDELTYLMTWGILTEEEVLSALSGRPADVHVVVTGRDAPSSLVKAADLVTEMSQMKHPFQTGIQAQPGIEY